MSCFKGSDSWQAEPASFMNDILPWHARTGQHDHCVQIAGFPWPIRQKPVAFLDIAEQEVAAGHRGSSWANPAEAKHVASLVSQLMLANKLLSSGEGIGVIMPCTGQVWDSLSVSLAAGKCKPCTSITQ